MIHRLLFIHLCCFQCLFYSPSLWGAGILSPLFPSVPLEVGPLPLIYGPPIAAIEGLGISSPSGSGRQAYFGAFWTQIYTLLIA